MTDLTLLHGFSQDPSVWDEVRKRLPHDWTVHAPTLPGHSADVNDLPSGPEDFVQRTLDLLEPADDSHTRVLVGYSLGGRLALDLALRIPDRWTHLVVVSAGAGLHGDSLRASRVRSDDRIAALLEEQGVERFADFWDTLELWAGDPPATRIARSEMIKGRRAAGLAAAVRSYGQGTAPDLWNRLESLTQRCLVVTGIRDSRYADATARLARSLPVCSEPTVVRAGHSVPLEAPKELASALRSHSRQA